MLNENLDAWILWQETRTQWRATGMGLVGLDYGEVRTAAAELEIFYGPRNRKKIKAMERCELNRVNSSQ